MDRQLQVIYGAGGHARELAAHFHSGGIELAGFVDDIAPSREVMGWQVYTREQALQRFEGASWHVAVGNIELRKRLLQMLKDVGVPLGSYVSPETSTTPWTRVEAPAQIFRGGILSCGVDLSHSVVINQGCILSHDVKVGSYTFIGPGVRVAGHVEIEDSVWIGAGAVIRNGSAGSALTIGSGTTIGMGACVVGSVPSGVVYLGNPARSRRLD